MTRVPLTQPTTLEEAEESDLTFPSPGYLAQFYEHLSDTRAHISGRDSSAPLPPSALSFSYWSSEEKDIFFHGLSIYSRLRPDLISADIGTKNVMEVAAFIDLLEDGIAKEEDAVPRPKWTAPSKSDINWDPVPRLKRRKFPIAMEMSERWCEFEAKQAAALLSVEPAMAAQAGQRRHEENIQAQRLAFRMKKGTAKAETGVRDRKAEKGRHRQLKEWIQTQEEKRVFEEFKTKFDGDTLVALDAILRDEEEKRLSDLTATDPVDNNGRGVRKHLKKTGRATDTPLEADNLSPAAGPSTSVPPTIEPSTVVVPDPPGFDIEMIDPALRSTDTSTPVGPSRLPTPPPITGPSSALTNPTFNPRTPPFPTSVLPVTDLVFIPQPMQLPPVPVPTESGSPSVTQGEDLTPVSRRRLYKRMYMRKKRAEQAGREADQTLVRLKPGRKGKSSAPVTAMPDDASTSQPKKSSHKPGLTRAYKTRAKVTDMGFDAERIRGEGFDLLRLSKFHKLMRLYNELHGADASVASSISAEVLKSLQEHLVHFVRQLAKKAFLSRSFERQTKARTKVWRISQRPIVRRRNVKHGLGLYAGKRLCKKRHFGKLRKMLEFKKIQQPQDEGAGESDDDEEEKEEEVEVARINSSLPTPLPAEEKPLTFERGVDRTKKRMPSPVRFLSTIRTIAPPYTHPPAAWQADPSQPSFDAQREPGAFYTPWEAPNRLREDDCIPSDHIEDGWVAEMEEEESLDALDMARAGEYERELWKMDWEKPPAPAKRKREEESTKPSKRAKTSSRRSKIKSKAYISDSD